MLSEEQHAAVLELIVVARLAAESFDAERGDDTTIEGRLLEITNRTARLLGVGE